MVKNVGDRLAYLQTIFYFSRVLQIVTSGLSELLNHVTSLKPLLHLKSSLVSLMTEVRSNFDRKINVQYVLGTYATMVNRM